MHILILLAVLALIPAAIRGFWLCARAIGFLIVAVIVAAMLGG
jgi:hypothetical protein